MTADRLRNSRLGLLRFLLAGLMLIAGAISPSAYAQREETAVEGWGREERALEFNSSDNGFVYGSRRDSTLGHDRIDGRLDAAAARLEYVFVSLDPGNETVIRLQLDFLSVIEYSDMDGDGRYDLPDAVVRRIDLPNHPNRSFESRALVPGGHEAVLSYVFDGDGSIIPIGDDPSLREPTLTLRFVVGSRGLNRDGHFVAPTQLGIETELRDYQYQNDSSQLALLLQLDSNADLDWGQAGRIAAQQLLFQTDLSWDPAALVNGSQRDVGLTLVGQARATSAPPSAPITVAYSFGRPASAYHDSALDSQRYQPVPAAGSLAPGLGLPGDIGLYVAGLAASILLVGGFGMARLRARR